MNCCEPNSQIVDSRFYSDGYTTPEARRIFCDLYRYQRWLDIEAALAMAEADLGIIPVRAAKIIAEKAHLRYINLDSVKKDLKESSHSLMPLLGALQQVCQDGAGQYIHFGATTQDIQDTATIHYRAATR